MIKGTFSENVKISVLNSTAANAVTCDRVDVSKYNYGAFVIIHEGSTDTDLTLTLYEATAVSGGTAAALAVACPIYHDVWSTTSDVLAATTAAYAITIDPATQGQYIAVMEIDPAILSQGYPCVYLDDSGGNSANNLVILWVGDPKNKGASLESGVA